MTFLINREDRPQAKHVRARFHLQRGLRKRELIFNDQRTFGWLSIEDSIEGIPTSAQHIAPDPFDALFDKSIFPVVSIFNPVTGKNLPLLLPIIVGLISPF